MVKAMINTNSIDAKQAGLDEDKLAEAARLIDQGYDEEHYPGSVWLVARNGKIGMIHSCGYTDFEHTAKVDEHTLYDLASLTKPIATAPTILLMCRDGLLSLDQSAASFFPGKNVKHLENVTIHHLLTHTSGLPAWVDLYSNGQDRNQAIEDLLNTPLENEPGTHYTYSCLGYILLSLIAENVTKERFNVLTSRYVFKPLNMVNTMYNPGSNSGYTIAATDNCPKRKKKLIGEVHDGNANILGGISGNAGLFSCVTDLAIYCQCMAQQNKIDKNSPFDAKILRQMTISAIPESIGGQSYGWYTYLNDFMPGSDYVSKVAIGHTGFTGNVIIIDPSKEFYCIGLSNRVCRQDDGDSFRIHRRRVIKNVIGAILC